MGGPAGDPGSAGDPGFLGELQGPRHLIGDTLEKVLLRGSTVPHVWDGDTHGSQLGVLRKLWMGLGPGGGSLGGAQGGNRV